MTISYARFVVHNRALDYVLLGWMPTPALQGTGHGEWSVLFVWRPCACGREMKEPLPGALAHTSPLAKCPTESVP